MATNKKDTNENKFVPEYESEYLSLPEMCKILNIGRILGARLCETEGFPAFKIQNRYKINKKKFYQWQAENMGKTVKIQPKTKQDKEDE